MIRDAAAAAFETAEYRIALGAKVFVRRIGRIDAAADAALRACGCRHTWAVVTACNPAARRTDAADNAARSDALLAEVMAAGWRHLPARNQAPNGDWEEPGLCLLDVDAPDLLALARRYRQRAYVAAQLGSEPTLVWTGF